MYLSEEHPRRLSLSVTHCEDRYLVVAFPVVYSVLSANLSVDEVL